MNLYQYLSEGKSVLALTDLGWSFLTLLEHHAMLNSNTMFSSSIQTIVVADEAMLQTKVSDVPEQAWDLLDFSDKFLILNLENTISVPDELTDEGYCSFRIVEDCPQLYNVMKRLRQPLLSFTLIDSKGNPIIEKSQIPTEYLAKADYVVDLQPLNKKPRSYSVIKIRLNGEIEIVRK